MTKGKGKNPGAGGLDKHIKRVAHKERSQPHARKNLGALEKHKDYVKRASRRKEKVKRLTELKRAAAQRNPDEFNVKMTQLVMDVATGKMKRKALSKKQREQEAAATLRENFANVNYLRHASEHDRRRATELLDEVIGQDLKPSNTHTVFVDDEEEVQAFRPAKYFGTTNEMLAYPATRGRVEVLEKMVLPESLALSTDAVLTKAQRLRARRALKRGTEDGANDGDDGPPAEEEDHAADADDVLGQRKAAHRAERLQAASKLKEISQRFRRSNSLRSLAEKVKARSDAIRRGINQKQQSRIRKGAVTRAR